MSPEIHASAATGFELAADAYERGRPDFPASTIDLLVEELDLRPGRTLLELGAGTGKLTRMLAASGVEIVAVEPVEAMRKVLASTVARVTILDAVAEAIPLTDGAADAAVAAQAFHWFDGPTVLEELARVLPRNGPLALVWNVRDEDEPWVRAITDLIEPYRGDTPSHRSMRWREAFDGASAWTPPERRSFTYVHATTPDATVDRVLSISFIASLPDDERASVGRRVRDLLPSGTGISFPYRTDVWLSRTR